MSATELLVEFVQTGSKLRIDRENGVIHGAKILGLTSKNRRKYLAAAVQEAAPLYQNVRVNIDHKEGQRSYADRIGTLRTVRSDGAGLRADLHLNLGHPMSQAVLWDAEHGTEGVGMSHNIDAKTSRGRDGTVIVESITKVHSVDLVCDPATTRDLAESTGDNDKAALVAAIAEEIGLPPEAVPELGGGLRYRESPDEIEAYLGSIKQHLVDKGLLAGRPPKLQAFDRADGDEDFLAAIGANRPGGDARFNEAVLGLPAGQQKAALDQALSLPSPNGFIKTISH